VKTTTHTPSTKCQYQDTISTRSAWTALSASGGGEHAAEPEHHEPDDHVRAMEPNQGIERRPKRFVAIVRPSR